MYLPLVGLANEFWPFGLRRQEKGTYLFGVPLVGFTGKGWSNAANLRALDEKDRLDVLKR